MRRRWLVLFLALLWAAPAGAIWVDGAECDADAESGTGVVGVAATYCPTAINGAESPQIVAPTGAVCGWDDGGEGGELEVRSCDTGARLLEDRLPDADTVPDAASSHFGIYPGTCFTVTATDTTGTEDDNGQTDGADATCTTCKVVCRAM